jgi:hypothetical protein
MTDNYRKDIQILMPLSVFLQEKLGEFDGQKS